MSNIDIIKDYYAACLSADIQEISRIVDPRCIIDEPSFLPYGQEPIIGPSRMMEVIAGTFFKVFEADAPMSRVEYFEFENKVIASSIWTMTGKYTGDQINGHYQEYFELQQHRIILMRPFYHAASEITAAFRAAEAAGVSFSS